MESTSSGGGMKLFCKAWTQHPDITNAPEGEEKEIQKCQENGIDLLRLRLVMTAFIANSKKSPVMALTKKQIF